MTGGALATRNYLRTAPYVIAAARAGQMTCRARLTVTCRAWLTGSGLRSYSRGLSPGRRSSVAGDPGNRAMLDT